MKRTYFWIALGFLLIILSTLTACVNSASQPVDTLDGTQWQLIFYRKTTVVEGTTVTAQFEKGEISGSAGCNSYFGSYEVKDQTLTIDQIGMTEMYCMDPEGVMEQETFYLESLADSQHYEIADGRLTIFRSDEETLVFEVLEQ